MQDHLHDLVREVSLRQFDGQVKHAAIGNLRLGLKDLLTPDMLVKRVQNNYMHYLESRSGYQIERTSSP